MYPRRIVLPLYSVLGVQMKYIKYVCLFDFNPFQGQLFPPYRSHFIDLFSKWIHWLLYDIKYCHLNGLATLFPDSHAIVSLWPWEPHTSFFETWFEIFNKYKTKVNTEFWTKLNDWSMNYQENVSKNIDRIGQLPSEYLGTNLDI